MVNRPNMGSVGNYRTFLIFIRINEMLYIYSHQFQIVKANLVAALCSRDTTVELIDYFGKLESDDWGDVVVSKAPITEIKNNLLKTLSTEDIDHSERIMYTTIYTILYRNAIDAVFRALVSSYADHYILKRILGKNLRITKKTLEDIIGNILDVGLPWDETDREAFDVMFDDCYGALDEIETESPAIKFGEYIDEEKAWEHMRIISMAYLSTLKAVVVDKKSPDQKKRSWLIDGIMEQLSDITELLNTVHERAPSVVGIGAIDTNHSAATAIIMLEEGDFESTGVVLLDKETPLPETFANDLEAEHNRYDLMHGTANTAVLVSKGVPIPRLTPMIREELTELYLHEYGL